MGWRITISEVKFFGGSGREVFHRYNILLPSSSFIQSLLFSSPALEYTWAVELSKFRVRATAPTAGIGKVFKWSDCRHQSNYKIYHSIFTASQLHLRRWRLFLFRVRNVGNIFIFQLRWCDFVIRLRLFNRSHLNYCVSLHTISYAAPDGWPCTESSALNTRKTTSVIYYYVHTTEW